jgi:hypothetical protein
MSVTDDAQARYDDAKARRKRILAEWEKLGRPVLSPTGRGQHPLLKALNDVDVVCARLGRELKAPARAGRPPGAVSAPDRKAPPRVKLRKVS